MRLQSRAENFFPRLAKANQEIRFARIQALCRHSFAHAIDQKIVKNTVANCGTFTHVFYHVENGEGASDSIRNM